MKPVALTTRLEVTRREALKAFGAAFAMVGCNLERTGEEIRPPVARLDGPGPRYFATSMVIDGYATGLLAETHTGRPTKLEGNPAHPASRGGTTAQHQASILELYDPFRLTAPQRLGMPASWARLAVELRRPPGGEHWLVVAPDGSPARAALLERLRARDPELRIAVHAPLDRRAAFAGAALAFGQPSEVQLAFDRADVVVALDADPFGAMPNAARWSRDFAIRRRAVEPGERPNQLFVAEPAITPTGSLADHRLAVRAGDVAAIAAALADALAVRGLPRLAPRTRPGDRAWIERAAAALARSRGRCAIVVGDRQPAAVHALAHHLAVAFGAETTSFTDPVIDAGDGLGELRASLAARRVGTLFALDCDPAELAPALGSVPLTAALSLHPTAFGQACAWQLPLSHYLESWGDARAWDGTVSPIQPPIRPLHDTRSVLQLLALLDGDAHEDRAIVRAQYQALDDARWRDFLAEGVLPGSAAKPRTPALRDAGPLAEQLARALAQPADPIELDLAPSPALGDGRFAHNPWLQELPHPITKQTWGNAALMSRATAEELGVASGDVVRLARGPATIELPAFVAPGHADRAITIELGYGAHPGSPVANGVGTGVAPLALPGPIARGITAVPAGRTVQLAITQSELDQHGRELALHATLAEYRARPDFTAHLRGPQPTLLPEREPNDLPQWAMTIDTSICTGCSSCVIACQAENNVPVVGFDAVRRGREMHWLRIDTYIEDATVIHQPMLCQHCERAPCEYVCPVNATVHSPDGLNEMVYNRCVGTRFCSNNCPYKVRRFNWFSFDRPADLRSLQHNPEVTVRARGVMEKCTYCVQRIRTAEHRALVEDRPIAPGEVVTACQQACPTQAIQFAALQHAETPMVRWRGAPRAYAVLHELGTRPRTMYLAKITNPEER